MLMESIFASRRGAQHLAHPREVETVAEAGGTAEALEHCRMCMPDAIMLDAASASCEKLGQLLARFNAAVDELRGRIEKLEAERQVPMKEQEKPCQPTQ